jgi:hypothetical protein
MPNRGIVYRCHGDNYTEKCYHSLLSLRVLGVKAAQYPVVVFNFNRNGNEWIEKISKLPNLSVLNVKCAENYSNAVDRLHRFEHTGGFDTELRMDCDTFFLKDPERLFVEAEKHGIVGVLDCGESRIPSLYGKQIYQINGGVLCYTKEIAALVNRKCLEILHDGFLFNLIRRGELSQREVYRTGFRVGHDNKLYILRDQPLLNTVLDRMGLQSENNLLPVEYNAQRRQENTVIFHPYFKAREQPCTINEIKSIERGNLEFLEYVEGRVYLYFGDEGEGRKWNDAAMCFANGNQIPSWMKSCRLKFVVKFQDAEAEARNVSSICSILGGIEKIEGFGRVDLWPALAANQFNGILSKLSL